MKEKLGVRFVSTVIILWAADLLSKLWALEALNERSLIPVISDVLRFRLVYNTGGVFGIFQGNPYLFQLLTGLAIIFLILYYLKTPESNRLFSIAISLILGGAIGNFTDRFFRPGVVDFVDMGIGIHRWPTYNIADSAISIGAVLLAIAFIQIERKTKKQPEIPKN